MQLLSNAVTVPYAALTREDVSPNGEAVSFLSDSQERLRSLR